MSAIRLFGGRPLRIAATRVVDTAESADGCDLRTSALMELPGGVSAQFDVALDHPRRDELELVGTGGTIVVPDPWLCREGRVVVIEKGNEANPRVFEADPDGVFGLSPDAENDDAYRLEMEHASRVIRGEDTDPFGRADAIEQAAVLAAVRTASVTGEWVTIEEVAS